MASLPWVEGGIKYLLNDVAAGKIILGVPFYTHDFSNEYPQGSEYIGMDEIQRRITEYKASVYWDSDVGQNVATYQRNGFNHKIWVEGDRSLGLKLDLVNKYGLSGMAAWSLGTEFSSTWNVKYLVIGQKLIIPKAPASVQPVYHMVQAGDTLCKPIYVGQRLRVS